MTLTFKTSNIERKLENSIGSVAYPEAEVCSPHTDVQTEYDGLRNDQIPRCPFEGGQGYGLFSHEAPVDDNATVGVYQCPH